MAITKPHQRTVWSRDVLLALRKAQVSSNITNSNYEGEVQQAGSVKVFSPDAVTVGTYDGSDITFQEGDGTDQTMAIDQADYFAVTLNDVGQAQTNINLVGTFMNQAGYALADAYDQYIFGQYTGAATANQIDATTATGSPAWTASDAYTIIVEAAENLDNQSVPNAGRYLVVRPTEFADLRNSATFTPASELGDDVKQSGAIGQIAGFNLYMSRNIYEGTSYAYPLYGHQIALTAADQINKVETGRTEKNFKDFMKGLHVYGSEVVRDDALGYIKVDK